MFPDVDGATCRPVSPADGLANSAGAAPTEAYVCDYSSTAPGAVVAFTQWGDASAARTWYDDTTRLGPRIEEFDTWQVGGVEQGALYTAQYQGRVVSTGIYDGTPYGWEIRTANLDQSNQVFNALRFQQRTAFGS
ncbi:hypothetical protein GCM10023200_53080 [Actinomycetospora chlora]|uniref:DUF3558 domain-containing protein n=1 Tax=Actinomycetospora chlora TaxID=663608 RepID=A0ABP9CDT9_9PSEU